MPDASSDSNFPGDDDLFIILDRRAFRDVSTPVFVYDLYMPLIGAEAIGVYGAYCRLSGLQPPKSAGMRYAIGSIRFMADNCRIGKSTVTKVNQMLMDCGLIGIDPPTDWQKSRHFANQVVLLDPPESPSREAIDKYAKNGYHPMCDWLYGTSIPDDPVLTWVRAEETPYPGKDEQSKPRTQIGTGNGHIPYLSGYAKTSSLPIREDSESQEESTYVNPGYDDESGASVMESGDDAELVRQVQLNLLVAAQQHGWFGSGWEWSKKERELVVENLDVLTAERIEYAVGQWWDVKESAERFNPSRSLAYVVAICKNYQPQPQPVAGRKKAKYNGNGTNSGNGQVYLRRVAEIIPEHERQLAA